MSTHEDESFGGAASNRPDRVDVFECQGMRQLARGGRGVSELAFALEWQKSTVARHVHGECDHQMRPFVIERYPEGGNR